MEKRIIYVIPVKVEVAEPDTSRDYVVHFRLDNTTHYSMYRLPPTRAIYTNARDELDAVLKVVAWMNDPEVRRGSSWGGGGFTFILGKA